MARGWVRLLPLVLTLLLASSAGAVPPGRAFDEDQAAAVGLQRAALELGAGVDQVTVTSEGVVHPWGVEPGFYVATYLAGESYTAIWVDLSTLEPYDRDGLLAVTAEARAQLGKYSPAVRAALDAMKDGETTTVAVGFVSDWRERALAEYDTLRTGITVLDGMPDSGDDALNKVALAHLRSLRMEQLAADAAAPRAAAEAAGLKVEYVSRFLPMMWVTGTREHIEMLMRDESLLYALGSYPTSLAMAWAYPTDRADYAFDGGYKGSGASIAVVEYNNVDWGHSDFAGLVQPDDRKSLSTGMCCQVDPTKQHPKWVMGAIAGQSAGHRGIAPKAFFISSSTGGAENPNEAQDYRVIEAVENAVDYAPHPADVINLSLVQDTGQNGGPSGDGAQALKAYLDQLANVEGVSIAAAGGNNYVQQSPYLDERQCQNNGHKVLSPGSAWNVLAAGNLDDHDTDDWVDQEIFYYGGNPGFCWEDPARNDDDPDDRIKPELAAPGVDVSTAGVNATGVSIATPQVAGTMAVLIGMKPARLRGWPQVTRAIIIAATKFHDTPGGTLDDEGYGSLNVKRAVQIAEENGYGKFGRLTFSSPQSHTPFSAPPSQYVDLTPGAGTVRFTIAWNSHGFYSSSGGTASTHSDERKSIFQCIVRNKGTGTLIEQSTRIAPNLKNCSWEAQSGVTYRVEIKPTPSGWSDTLPSETVGWAFAAE